MAMTVAPTWPALDPWADAVNPALGGVIALGLVLALARRHWREAAAWPIGLVAALAVAYGLAALDRAIGAFASAGADYSTHAAVHLAAWAVLLGLRPTWRPAAAVVTLGYGVLMVLQGYHTTFDLLATAAATLPLLVPLSIVLSRHGRCTLPRHAGRGPHRP